MAKPIKKKPAKKKPVDISGTVGRPEAFGESVITLPKEKNAPGTLFLPPNSSLPLDEERLYTLAEMALNRLSAIDTSRGPWLADRDISEREFADDFSHRANRLKRPDGKIEDSIFQKSNISYNTTRRQCIPIIAKMTKDYVGSEPFFEVRPRFTEKPEFELEPQPDAIAQEKQQAAGAGGVAADGSSAPVQTDPFTPGMPASSTPFPTAMPGAVPPPPGGEIAPPAAMPGPMGGAPAPPDPGMQPPAAPPLQAPLPPVVKLPTLSERINWMSQYKIGQSNAKEAIAQAIANAVVIGEQVLKIAYREQANVYQRYAEVLVSAPGVQVTTKDGDPVYRTDAWRAMPDGTQALAKDHKIRRFKLPGMDATIAEEMETLDPITGGMVKTWVDTFQPQVFEDMLAKGRKVLYRGPDFAPITRRDFYCSLDARTIHEAECIAHVFDLDVIDLLNYLVGGLSREDLKRPGQMEWFERNDELMQVLKGNSARRKSDVGQPRPLLNEQEESRDDEYNQKAQIAEVYIRADADGDGKPEEIMLIIDKEHRKCLWWDYTVNCTPRGVRPFEVVRIYPALDRWYGISESKRQAANQFVIDFCVNRLMYQANLNGDITGYDPSVCPAWNTEVPVPGKAYPIARDKDPQQVAGAIVKWSINDIPEGLREIMQETMQMSQLISGNMNPGEQNNAQLPAASLATGIRAITRAGQLLDALRDINAEPGVRAAVFLGVRVMLRHMEPEEEFEYTNGDRILSDSITREEVECLDLDVKLSLGVGRAEEQIQVLELARQIAIEFFGLPPDVQQLIRPLYIHAFKSLDIPESDAIFQPRVPPPGAMIGPDGQMQPMPPPAGMPTIKPPPNDPTLQNQPPAGI